MSNRSLIALLVTAVVGLSACGPSEDSIQSQGGQAAPPTDQTLLEQAKAKAKVAAEKAADLTENAVATSKEMASAAVAKGKELAEQAKPAMHSAREAVSEKMGEAAERSAAAAQAVGEATDAAVQRAREWIQQAQDYIAENKPELARQLVDKLNAVKGAMPESIRVQIDKLDAHLGGGSASAPTPTQGEAPAAPPQAQ
jgi:ElaB/YqjD/DUF883 family membrane-anchored ribosome-binding protein